MVSPSDPPAKASTILYAHGLGSSPESPKANWIRAEADALGLGFVGPQLPVPPEADIAEMLEVLSDVFEAISGQVVLVGSSVGGYATTLLAHRLVQRGVTSVRGLFLLAPAFDLAGLIETQLPPGAEETWRKKVYITAGKHVLPYRFLTEARAQPRWPVWQPAKTVILHAPDDEEVPYGGSARYAERGCSLIPCQGGHTMEGQETRVRQELRLHLERWLATEVAGSS